MAKASFGYSAVTLGASPAFPNGLTIYRPTVSALITAITARRATLLVLADSGADYCCFPLSVAHHLGLHLPSLPHSITGGVGADANITYYTDIHIDLGSGISFIAYTGFTAGLDALGIGILGQNGFFDSYNVEFRHNEKIFTVASIDKP